MGIIVRDRVAQYHESALMELVQRPQGGIAASGGSEEQLELLQAEPRLPSGWEKCLDLKSGLIYFKDWNSGTLTYRDPRQFPVPLSTQRIGLLSISLSPEKLQSSSTKRKLVEPGTVLNQFKLPWDCKNNSSMDEQSLELSLNLPGTPSRTRSSSQDGSVCTMEKVRSALERSQWLQCLQMKSTGPSTGTGTPSRTLSLLSSRPSTSSRESSSPHLESRSSATTSQCSSDCFTSPSVMSFQGDDEEVQQPRECRDSGAKSQVESDQQGNDGSPVMVTVGCKSCLMYVMLSKSHPSCPKCGNTDVLLELPVPLPKKRRCMGSPSWSWCAA